MNKKAVIMTAFFHVSKKILIVFYDDIIFPDILCRKENCLFFRKNIQDGDVPDTPNESIMPMKSVQEIGQIMFLQK